MTSTFFLDPRNCFLSHKRSSQTIEVLEYRSGMRNPRVLSYLILAICGAAWTTFNGNFEIVSFHTN